METETYRPARLILLGDDATPGLRRATSLDALVGQSSPPFFLWHTAEDVYVPPEHTYRLAASLAANAVPHSVHVFAHGPHSLGLATGSGDAAAWTTLAASWIAEQSHARRVTLRDGSTVEIRQLRPADAAGLDDAFEHLSTESRYLRFLGSKPHLTPRELTYLTQVDHSNHEALLAIDAVTRQGVGVARYVRAQDRPDEAEFAVVVADEWRGRGLGTALLRALAACAREQRIGWFTGLVLNENRSMLHVVAVLGGRGQGPSVAGTVEVRLNLAEVPAEGHSPHLAG